MTLATSSRRDVLGAIVVLFSVGCTRHGPRCAYCGMTMDPKSGWNAELTRADESKLEFDSPRCALLAWRTGQVEATQLRVQEYYERAWKGGEEVVFVVSSDVVGPMGADLVPVDPARARIFVRDHTGTRPLRLAEITPELLKDLH